MIVADASALVKTVINEPLSGLIKTELDKRILGQEPIVVPDIALGEVANALWKYAFIRRELSKAEFAEAIRDLLAVWKNLSVVSAATIMQNAAQIAGDTGLTIYDSLYLAISREFDAPLLTFDKAMIGKARDVEVEIIKIL